MVGSCSSKKFANVPGNVLEIMFPGGKEDGRSEAIGRAFEADKPPGARGHLQDLDSPGARDAPYGGVQPVFYRGLAGMLLRDVAEEHDLTDPRVASHSLSLARPKRWLPVATATSIDAKNNLEQGE
jgi:hypothetical protein